MRKLGWVVALALAVCIGHFGHKAWKWAGKKPANEFVVAVTEHKPFVIIIPSYNNVKWCEKNLRSALEQDYDNFRVVFIDDASTDGMGAKVQELIARSDKAALIRNRANRGAMENIYRAAHSCSDHEIVVLLDGDDWLAHDGVLRRLNEAYADPNIWITYGSYLDYPSYKKGDCSKPIPKKWIRERRLRKEPLQSSHLKTFYAGLFKKIPMGDFILGGKFYETASDLAFMTAMIEMAGLEHSKHVKSVLYIYNRANPLNDDKVRMANLQTTSSHIREMAPYAELKELAVVKPEKADLVVFSFDRPMQLYALLESVEKRITGIGETRVVYRASSSVFEEGYATVKRRFPAVVFQAQGENPKEDFKPLLLEAVFDSPAPYVVFAVDDLVVSEEVNLGVCTEALQETGAYGFYLRLGKNTDYCYMLDRHMGVPASIDLGSGIFAWQFAHSEGDWKYPNTVDLTVFAKAEIEPFLRKVKYHNPTTFECYWAGKADFNKIGLYFEHSRMVNIPLNLVNTSGNRFMHSYTTKELMEKFQAGLKIDIDQLQKLDNRSPHIDHEIVFVDR